MTVTDAHRLAMPELAEARTRLDAETVAPERRTPAVPITRFSYDRDAMRAARSARTRMGAPLSATDPAAPPAAPSTSPEVPPPPTSTTAPVGPGPARPVPVRPVPVRPVADTAPPASGDQPIYVVACVAVYPGAVAVPPVPVTRTAARAVVAGPAPAAAPVPAAPRRSGPPSILSAPPPVRAVPEPEVARPALDPVAARAEAAEADARLRAVALARRSAALQERLAAEVAPGAEAATAAPSSRPRLLRRAASA